MNRSLLDLLQPPGGRMAERIYGVVTGVVTNNEDPQGLGRVKLKFPWLSEQDESWWARTAVLMGGPERGTYFLPEVDDEVLVAFEHGDTRFPYVLGTLWNASARPPETNKSGTNDRRVIHSRSGHIIRLDDTDGAEKIEIIDSTGSNSITIDSAEKTITIAADADLIIQSANGKLVLSAGNGVEITSQAGVKVQGSQDVDVKSAAQLNLNGSMVNIN
jgi:uncharacterized protein involved in type VI secretion and phage assembly